MGLAETLFVVQTLGGPFLAPTPQGLQDGRFHLADASQ